MHTTYTHIHAHNTHNTHTRAYKQMKLFQAALEHRSSITITTDEAKAVDEECVVVASSLTMLEFIANMLPVSLR